MLHDVWKTATFGNMSADSNSLTTNKFRPNHFFKNAHGRMRCLLLRCLLSFQVFSRSMLTMTNENQHKLRSAGPDTCDSFKVIIKHTDRFADMMNGANKGCTTCIDSKKHQHLKELLDAVMIFTEWKDEAGKNKDAFVPMSTCEDLCWVVFSMVCIARHQLPTQGGVLVQKRAGSDVCEHQFSKSTAKNANRTAEDHRHILAHAQGMANTFSRASKSNSAGDRTVISSETTAPLPKRTGRMKKK